MKHAQDCSNKLLQKGIVRDCITMCFDICTINIRVSIRVRGLHLVFLKKIVNGTIHRSCTSGHDWEK